MRRLAIVVALAAGCSSSSPPTYWSSIKAIADEKCVGCHSEGNIAPFTLTSYADFASHSGMVRQAVMSRVMPPWPPGQGCSDYVADRSLTDDQIATITSWIDAGAVEGNPKDYHQAQSTVPGLSRVDRTLQLAAPYTPTLSPDEYRCFLMDWPDTTDKYISGFRAKPGNAKIVHHVIAFLAEPADVPTYQQLDAADATPGWVCFGGPGGNARARWLGAWAPGSLGTDYPPNTGLKVVPGSKVVLQVHYNLTQNDGGADQTGVELKLDDSVQKQAIIQPWANLSWIQQQTMVIPAGTPDQKISWAFNPASYWPYITNNLIAANVPVTMWSASLHMHTRGIRARLEIQHADGTNECMLDIPKWDFHWQGAYGFVQPKTYQPDDTLYLECHFDNSNSTIDRNWGEGTDDEMCLGGFYLTQ
jgi:hypothetical protein